MLKLGATSGGEFTWCLAEVALFFLKNLKCSGVPVSFHGALTVWERWVTSHIFLAYSKNWQALSVKAQ